MSPFFKLKPTDSLKAEAKKVVLHYVEAEIPQTEQTSLQRYKQLKQLLNECFAYHKKQNKIETEEEKILLKINDPDEPKTEGALLKIIVEAFYSDNPKQNLKSNLPGYIDHVLCEYFEIKDKIANQFMIKRKDLDAHPPKIQPTYNQILRTVKHELVANKVAPRELQELQELKSMAISTKPKEFKHHMIDTIQSYLNSNEGDQLVKLVRIL